MNRISLSLAIVAAWGLVCLTAFAGDAAIVPETVQVHWLLAIMFVAIPAIRTGLSDDTIHLPGAVAPLRALIVAGLAGVSAIGDSLMSGGTIKGALMAFVILGLPSLLQELIKWLAGANTPLSGKPSSPMFPPAMLLLIMLWCIGCGAGKIVCPILDTAAELCPLIAVRLPDGTTEMVRSDEIAGLAQQTRARRLAGAAKPSDAGADR